MAALGQHRWKIPDRRPWALVIVVLTAGLGVTLAMRQLTATADLATVEYDVARRWPQVTHLPRSHLSEILAKHRSDVVIFDAREREEYDVSHLPGAIRVDPDMSREKFLTTHAAALSGKSAVFYCSVGVRSSQLAARVQNDLKRGGVQQAYNLAGGIFGWHNDARPLANAFGVADRVHGYDARWSRLLTR